ncbi:hypothetical protein K8P10_001336 [Leucobacter sp. Psy1]|uniref:hypothetical protein n=1 Tax=Leucobacter sp. Psy1 TaxID=2875729 RepID=UPI001CD59CE1|nr:hypothetical protein [Leucobacter sp. Psy1]UBH05825.1 hypothetical protein K8P10_001336 [Leucobacter sp. Psy1]
MTDQQPPPQQVPGAAPWQAAPRPRGSVWFAWSIAVLSWAVLAIGGGAVTVMYLGLGVVMTNTIDGVFGSEPEYAFNWILLWTALIGQLLGVLASVLVSVMALRDRKRGLRLATAATVMGFVALAVFLLIGLFQLPLVSILFDVLAL